jgi:GNAT superfamily N-acetyltransferase
MEIRKKSVLELTALEYRACFGANYGGGGYMQGVLEDCREGNQSGEVVMLWDETKAKNRVSSMVGWCLMTPVSLHGILGATRYTKRRSKITAQFWVKPAHRQKGYAKMLMHEVKKVDPRPHVIPHNDSSAEFFSSFEVTVLRDEAGWIRRKKPKVA